MNNRDKLLYILKYHILFGEKVFKYGIRTDFETLHCHDFSFVSLNMSIDDYWYVCPLKLKQTST